MGSCENALLSLPECLYLEVTNRCNLRCLTCVQHRGMKESPRDLSLEEARLIGDQLSTIKRAVLHGIGEPLLNKDLPAIVRFFKVRGVHVLFNSNALLLSPELAGSLIESELDELRVSMDAANESTYVRIRGSGNFSVVVKNIETLLQLRQKSRRSKPRVSVWMVGTRENIQDLPGLILLSSLLGIDEVYLQRLVYPLDGPGYGLADREQTVADPPQYIQEILVESMRLSRRTGVLLSASGLTPPDRSLHSESRAQAPWRQCRRPWDATYITAWGNVLPCCISPFSTLDYDSLILGNAFRQRFEEIWNGEKYGAFRRKHQSLSPPLNCIGCGVEWSL
jgi:MoaA/NifB/PqqE/SkfB family radical SAM enzyme